MIYPLPHQILYLCSQMILNYFLKCAIKMIYSNFNKIYVDSLIQWSELWQLRFNPDKCTILHLGKVNPHYTYQMGSHLLEASDYQKDLGVIVDSNLNFHRHCASVISKANQRLSVIRRSFTFLDAHTLLLFYKSLIRPVWSMGTLYMGPKIQT